MENRLTFQSEEKFPAVLPGTYVTCVPMWFREFRRADVHKQGAR
jgi:hypothetical protein